MDTKCRNSEKKGKMVRKIGAIAVRTMLTVAGVILLPPLLEKISVKRYKASLRKTMKHNN